MLPREFHWLIERKTLRVSVFLVNDVNIEIDLLVVYVGNNPRPIDLLIAPLIHFNFL